MSQATDRFKLAFEMLVRRLTSHYDYSAFYPCTVVDQNSDGTLELKPDSPNLPGFSNIAIKYGVPGVTVKVADGARVHIGWDNSDPSLPYAALWDPDSLNEIVITAATKVTVNAPLMSMGDHGQPIARQGDMVQIPATSFPGTPSVGYIYSGQTKVIA